MARCQVDYAGRLTAHLPMATRVLMIKADGSVLVHSDGGSYKPLNWMSPPCTLREGITEDGQVEWTRHGHRRPDDTLRILLEEVLHDSRHDLGVDPGLQKDGVEKHLQELLAEHPATLSAGLTLVRREFPTAIGPVDLMCRDADGLSVAVEIKRRGEIDGVEQLTRYLELLNRDPLLAPVPRHLRRPGDQAPGARARHRPRHRLRGRRLRRAARPRRQRAPASSKGSDCRRHLPHSPTASADWEGAPPRESGQLHHLARCGRRPSAEEGLHCTRSREPTSGERPTRSQRERLALTSPQTQRPASGRRVLHRVGRRTPSSRVDRPRRAACSDAAYRSSYRAAGGARAP